ncbi:MAG: CehA/McbA family metallohydrolase [Bacillota bacterium]
MKKLNLDYHIKKEDEKKYLFLPFDVPEGVEKMDILYSYKGDKDDSRVTEKQKNVIDFGLLDQNGDDIGTTGSEKRFITISPSFSTGGYKKRDIKKGRWQIIIGAYQIREEGVTVTYDITFHLKKFRWLKGDSHMHTTNSDGKHTALELANKAKSKGLDFIMITDHNNNLDDEPMPQVSGLTVIKGLELTNYKGHINMYGIGKPYDGSFAINSKEEFFKRTRQAIDREVLLSINHPMCSLCPWLMDYDFEYHAVEVWNGPMRRDNLKTINWWNERLKEGKKLPAIGGSDFHRDFYITDLFAHPTLRVFADCNSQKAILESIKKGRCVITNSPNSTMIDLSCNNAGIGDEIAFQKDMKVSVKVTNILKGHKLKVIDNEGCFFEFKAPKKGNYDFDIPLRQKGFVRCEIEYEKKPLSKLLHKALFYFIIRKEAYEKVPPFKYAITNPIYIV